MDGSVRVEALLEANRPQQARETVVHLLAADPQSATLWALLARACGDLGQWREQLDAANHAVALEPDSAYHHLLASQALTGLEHHRDAVLAAREAVRLQPFAWFAHTHLAETASVGKARDRDLAWAAANRGVELAPTEARTHAAVGLVALRFGQTAIAERALLAALRLDPNLSSAQHNLGVVRLEQGQMVSAATDIGASAAADPTAPQSQLALRLVVLRWLQRTHIGLWVAWLLGRMAAETGLDHEGLWWPSLAVVLVGGLALAWWTRITVVRVGGHLRRVLWTVLRGSATTSLWFALVVAGIACLLVGSLLPSPAAREALTQACGAALLVGCLVSWLQVGARKRSRG